MTGKKDDTNDPLMNLKIEPTSYDLEDRDEEWHYDLTDEEYYERDEEDRIAHLENLEKESRDTLLHNFIVYAIAIIIFHGLLVYLIYLSLDKGIAYSYISFIENYNSLFKFLLIGLSHIILLAGYILLLVKGNQLLKKLKLIK